MSEWENLRQAEEAIHEKRKSENIAVLRKTDLDMIVKTNTMGDVIQVRDSRYPFVDFETKLNRWTHGTKTTLGDASALVEWLERKRKA